MVSRGLSWWRNSQPPSTALITPQISVYAEVQGQYANQPLVAYEKNPIWTKDPKNTVFRDAAKRTGGWIPVAVDAGGGEDLAQPEVPGLAAMTADPRRYGFHATIKPPFRLREDPQPLLSPPILDEAGTTRKLDDFAGRVILLNIWATWCPPCVEELPMIEAFWREHAAKGLQVVGLAIDQPSAVRQFISRTMVTFPIGLAGLEGTELGKALGNSAGGLPFTVVFGTDGSVRQRKMGQLKPDDLAQWKAALDA